MRVLAAAAAVLCAVGVVSAEEDLGSAVVRGTEDNWDEVLETSPLVMVGFFAPWCGHCKKIKPHWNQLAEHYAAQAGDTSGGEAVSVAAVDVVAEPALYWKFDITAYPTIKLFRKGVPVGDCYARTKDDLVAWIEERRAFLASKIHRPATPEDLLALRNQDKTLPALKNAVVGLFRPQDSLQLEAFRSLALGALSSSAAGAAGGGPPPPSPPVFGIAAEEGVASLASALGVTSLPAIVSLRAFADPTTDETLHAGLTGLSRATMDKLGLIQDFGAVALEAEALDRLVQAVEDGEEDKDSKSAVSRLVEAAGAWVARERYPPVLRWSAKHKPFVFTRRPGFENHILLLLPSGEGDQAATVAAYEEALAAVALERPGEALFLSLRQGDDEATGLFSVFGADPRSLPSAVAVVSHATDNTVSFNSYPLDASTGSLPPLDAPEQVATFVQDFFDGKLSSRSPTPPSASRAPAEAANKAEAPAAEEVDESDVHVLRSEKAFDAFLEKHPLGLIEAYAPWCGHCKKLKPVYAKVATELATSQQGVAVAKFDATAEPLKELATKLGVEGFPTLFVAHRGAVFNYEGQRTYDGLLGSMRSFAGKIQAIQSTLSLDAIASSSADVVSKMRDVREASLGQQPAPRTLLMLTLVPPARLGDSQAVAAEELAGLVAFSLKFSDDDTLSAMGQELRHVVASADDSTLAALIDAGVIPSGVPTSVQESGESVVALLTLSSESMETGADFLRSLPSAIISMPGILAASPQVGAGRVLGFLQDNLRSPVVVYGENAAFEALLEATHVKQLLLFDHFSEDFDVRELTHVFEPLVAKFQRRVCVVVIDARHSQAMDFFNLDEAQLPASRFVDVASSKSYLVDLGGGVGGTLQEKSKRWAVAVAKALELAFDPEGNRLAAVGRSEPREAARMTTPLKKIVGDMWAEYVLERPSFDLLIEYFDPGCPHCKKMQPVLDTLAAVAFDEGKLAPRGNLIMVQLDATENDPDDWEMPSGVPTIHFYPGVAAGKSRTKDDFIHYTGGPDRKELVRFVEEHAISTPVWTAEKKTQASAVGGSHAAEL